MSDTLTQDQIVEITGYVRATPQQRVLRELGYVVLGCDGRGRVKALANHPNDPMIKNSTTESVRLNLA